MRITRLSWILAPLSLAVAVTAVRADEGCACCAAPAAACGCGCGNGDPGNCCDCCGPGTNPWDGTVKAGFGLRTSYNYITSQNAAVVPPGIVPGSPGGSSCYNFFSPDDARIYLKRKRVRRQD